MMRKIVRVYLPVMLLVIGITGIVRASISNESFTTALWSATLWVSAITVFLLLVFATPLIVLQRFWHRKKKKLDFQSDQKAKAIDRFMRNTPAVLGAIAILYAVVVAVSAYLIIPDGSPFAGDQINELAYKAPGFHIDVLQVPVELQPRQPGLIGRLLHGKPSAWHSIPITDYSFAGDSIYIVRYIGEGIQGMQLQYALTAITQQSLPREQQIAEIENHHLQHRTFLLGTDDLGRDFLSRIILGTRVSLSVGLVAVLIALFIGIPLGAFAGFYKRYPPRVAITRKKQWRIPVDNAIMWFINIIWSIPTLLLVFPVVFAFGQQFYTIFIAVGLTMWVDIARMVRGQVMQVREMEFVQATQTFGFSDSRAIWKHILPNITGPVIVITAANFAYAILTEAGLSFLGIGVQPPAPSWGLMIAKYKDNLITNPYLALIPGFAITFLVLAFFMVGNGLRDALDIKSRL